MKYKILGLVVIVSWLTQLVYLYPLPGTIIDAGVASSERTYEEYKQLAMKTQGEHAIIESKEQFVAKAKDNLTTTVWAGWAATLVLIVMGLIAGSLLVRGGRWRIALLVSSLAYVIVWWLFSGYIGSDASLGEYMRNLWGRAVVAQRTTAYMHRDVVLLGLYVCLAIFAGYHLVRRMPAAD